MTTGRTPRSTWADGRLYAVTIDRMLADLRTWVARNLPEGQRVLDACCGTGALARRLAREGRDVVGVDLSPRHIAYARSKASDTAGNLRFEVGDVSRLELPPDGPHDVAVISLALHEMPTDARVPVLRSLLEVARRVMILDFAAPMPRNLAGMRNRAAELVAGPSHFRAFRDYQRRGGSTPLVAATAATVESERSIDAGTLDVLVLAGPHARLRDDGEADT